MRRKNLDLIEVGTLRVSGVGEQGVLGGVIKFLPYKWVNNDVRSRNFAL